MLALRDFMLILGSVAGTVLLLSLIDRRIAVMERFVPDWYRADRKWDAPPNRKDIAWDVAVARTVPLRQSTTLWLPEEDRIDPIKACSVVCANDPLCQAFGTIISGESKGLCHLYQDLTLPRLEDATQYSNYAIGYPRKENNKTPKAPLATTTNQSSVIKSLS